MHDASSTVPTTRVFSASCRHSAGEILMKDCSQCRNKRCIVTYIGDNETYRQPSVFLCRLIEVLRPCDSRIKWCCCRQSSYDVTYNVRRQTQPIRDRLGSCEERITRGGQSITNFCQMGKTKNFDLGTIERSKVIITPLHKGILSREVASFILTSGSKLL